MSDRIRIAFFGSSVVSAYWNGAATYYRGIIRALNRRGHSITFYEPDAYDRQKHRDLVKDPPWVKVVVYRPETPDVDRCLEEAQQADLIVKASGVGVFDEYLEAAIVALKKEGKNIVYWDVDAPATLDRLNQNPSDPFLPLIPKFDCVLTYGGGDPVANAYRALGAQDCVPIYNALDPESHHPVPFDSRFAGDLGFLGNRLPDREQRVEEFFLSAAARLPGRVFLLGGNGWGEKQLPEAVKYLDHVYTTDHNAFNCSVDKVLNISRESMARYGFSPATRVFEAAGAAACLITDNWEGISHFLEPNREILVARSGEEVADLVERVPAHEAHKIGRSALRRVLAHHTYDHRAAQLDEVFDAKLSLHAGAAQ